MAVSNTPEYRDIALVLEQGLAVTERRVREVLEFGIKYVISIFLLLFCQIKRKTMIMLASGQNWWTRKRLPKPIIDSSASHSLLKYGSSPDMS